MIQQEIEFFYPLTEQIPLDLIYEETKPEFYYGVTSGLYTFKENGALFTTVSSTTNHFMIDCDVVTFRSKKKHTFIQKLLFKVMGIKVQDNGR